MKRIIILVCLLCLVVCLALPAFAASNWLNVNDLNDYFTRTIPVQYSVANQYTFFQTNPSSYYGGNYYSGQLNWQNTSVGTSRSVTFRYFPTGYGNSFKLSSFPAGTTSFDITLPFDLNIIYADANSRVPGFNILLRVAYYDSTGTEIGGYPIASRTPFDGSPSYVLRGTSSIPVDADSFAIRVDFTIDVANAHSIYTNRVQTLSPMTITCNVPFVQVASVVDPYSTGKVSYDSDTEFVTFKTDLYNYSWCNTSGSVGFGNAFEFTTTMAGLDNEDVYGFPLGATGFISADGFAPSSQLKLSFTVNTTVPAATQSFDVVSSLRLLLYDSNFNLLSSGSDIILNSIVSNEAYYLPFTSTFDSVVNTELFAQASYFRIVYFCELNGVDDETDLTNVVTYVDSSVMEVVLPYSSIFQLQEQGKITNKKLEDIENAISGPGGTNDKLDEIINGTVTPEVPEDSDIVGDLEDQESNIRDDASEQFGEAEDMQASALDVIFMYAGAFSAISLLFDAFATIPFFSGLLYVSVAVGIFAMVVGLGISVGMAAKYSSKSSKRS